ncbi:MAG: S-layer homology domain-containing protein [Thermoleophilia bacterium]
MTRGNRMTRRSRLVLIAFMVVAATLLIAASAFGASGFTDVPSTHAFYPDITRLADLEIVGGFPDGSFRPDDPVTRQQFAKIIVLATGRHTETVDNQNDPTFSDVTPDLGIPYPFDYIEEAAEAGFVQGNLGAFNPGNNITRTQLALILVRAGGSALEEPTAGYSTGFGDISELTSEAQSAIAKAKFNGILDGKTAIVFDPYSNASRGHVAKMLSRLLDKIGEPGGTVLQGTVKNTAGAGLSAHVIVSDPETHETIVEADTAVDGSYSVDLGDHVGGTYVKAVPISGAYFENQEYRFVTEGATNTRDIVCSATTPAGATFVGPAGCMACHPTQGATYPETFHARSIQEDLSEFNSTGWPAVGAETELDFMVAVKGEGTATVKPVLLHPTADTYAVRVGSDVLSVDGTYGGLDATNPEWKQRYLTKVQEQDNLQDETSKQDYLIIPIQWNENSEFDRSKWVAYSATNWWNTSTRTFGTQCAGCHNTAPDIVFNAQNQVVHYDYLELNMTCESCHGAGSAHVAAGGGRAKAIVNPNYMIDLTSQEICGQCHSRGDSVEPEGHEYPWNDELAGAYPIGADLFDYYSWGFDQNKAKTWYWQAAPGDPAYPSGYIGARSHHEQINDLVEGAMPMVKCAECHNVHGTDYRRNLRGDPNGDTAATNTCTAAGACHVHDDILAEGSAHREAGLLDMGQIDNDCTWCHMAETAGSAQFYNVDEAGTYKQGDIANHTFRPIRPDTLDKEGARVPDSCNMIGCHASAGLFPVTGGTFDAKAAIVTGQ